MPEGLISSKRLQISQANTTVVIVVAVCSVLTSFSLVISKSLWNQYTYQAKVIGKQDKALKVAKANVAAVDPLLAAYQAFDAKDPNMIGGNVSGTTDRDGDNAKLVLDALPSKNDVPALISSLEKILRAKNFGADSGITATDTGDVVATSPQKAEIPFQLNVKGSYASIQDLITTFERSIRPISITSLDIGGDEANVTLNIKASTYYQPGKTLNVTTEVVK